MAGGHCYGCYGKIRVPVAHGMWATGNLNPYRYSTWYLYKYRPCRQGILPVPVQYGQQYHDKKGSVRIGYN